MFRAEFEPASPHYVKSTYSMSLLVRYRCLKMYIHINVEITLLM